MHLKLRFTHGSDAPQYNILQKLTYGIILFVVLPVMVLAGLEMSPRIDAALPWLRVIFGGRKARVPSTSSWPGRWRPSSPFTL